MNHCLHAGVCAGCPWIEMAYESQLQKKQESYRADWEETGLSEVPTFAITSVAPFGMRDRVDLVLAEVDGVMRLGLYGNHREIVAIQHCPQMSEPLQRWFEEFRLDLPRLKKGSLRLRVDPQGTRGAWLDFSNEEVKRLFEEREWLIRLREKGIIEIGQRKKRLEIVDGQPKLRDPQLHAWMNTPGEDKTISLLSSIGSFSQPGDQANHALVGEVMKQARQVPVTHWLELGAGSGNFSLPLMARGLFVHAVEIDPAAAEGLAQVAENEGLTYHLQIHRQSFEKELARGLPVDVSGWGYLADPPRSGLGNFLEVLERTPASERFSTLIYVSCWQESFFKDAARLKGMGYFPVTTQGVDIFPQSPHAEWVTTFTRGGKP